MTSNEARPLLAGSDEGSPIAPDQESQKPIQRTTPLPKKDLFVLCCMRFSEPVSYHLIFPFINEMIRSIGMENPGYSSGLVEGIFAFAQLCTVYYWGSLSDRIGRRPVLLFGLLGIALFTTLFGLSKSFLMLLAFRFMAGACNGNVAVIKSAIAEMTDETNQGRAFSFLPLSWSVGSVVAPLIGGFLSRPAEQYPAIFGGWQLFINYPYLLPCLAGAAITLLGWIIGYFFLDETLGGLQPPKPPPREEPLASSASSATATVPDYGAATSPPPPADPLIRMTAREIFADVIIRRVLVSYVFLAVVTVSIDVVLVLWLYMPVTQGGVNFTTKEIGAFLSGQGIFSTFINLVVFPPLQRRIGTLRIYRIAMALNVPLIALFPLVTQIAVRETAASFKDERVGTKIGVAIIIIIKCLVGMIFAANMILVSRSAPSRTSLGAINGVAQMVASSMRALGPTVATIFFALSTDAKYQLLGGQFIWVYMFGLALVGVYTSLRVQEGRGSPS